MTNILINLLIAYTEHLNRHEAHIRKQARHESATSTTEPTP